VGGSFPLTLGRLPEPTRSVRTLVSAAQKRYDYYMKDTWFIQIQDENFNVLLLNQVVGSYKKTNKWFDKAVDKIVREYPSMKYWEARRGVPFEERVVMC